MKALPGRSTKVILSTLANVSWLNQWRANAVWLETWGDFSLLFDQQEFHLSEVISTYRLGRHDSIHDFRRKAYFENLWHNILEDWVSSSQSFHFWFTDSLFRFIFNSIRCGFVRQIAFLKPFLFFFMTVFTKLTLNINLKTNRKTFYKFLTWCF